MHKRTTTVESPMIKSMSNPLNASRENKRSLFSDFIKSLPAYAFEMRQHMP